MGSRRILVVDNYDSFTFTVVDYLRALGAAVDVVRNDEEDASAMVARKVDGVVTSPGPGHPEDARETMALTRMLIEAERPLLGICLGHQAIALACGGKVERAPPVHGKVETITHDGSGLFAGLPKDFDVTRYHSLVATNLAPPLLASAWSVDGTIMALRHTEAPVHGVQFHPESIASQHGHAMLEAFLDLCA